MPTVHSCPSGAWCVVRGAWCVGSSLGAVIKHAHSPEAAHTNHSVFGKCPSSAHLRAVIRRSAVRAAWQHLVGREPRFLRPTEARREVPPSSKTGKVLSLIAWNKKNRYAAVAWPRCSVVMRAERRSRTVCSPSASSTAIPLLIISTQPQELTHSTPAHIQAIPQSWQYRDVQLAQRIISLCCSPCSSWLRRHLT